MDLSPDHYEKYKKLWRAINADGFGDARSGAWLLGGKVGTPSYESARLFASVVCKAYFASGGHFEWLEYSRLVEVCKSDMKYSDQETMVRRLEKVNCLVIDGFGLVSYWNKMEFEHWFTRVLFARAKDLKPTLIITTIHPSQVSKFYSDSVAQVVGGMKSGVDFTGVPDVAVS